MRAVFHSHAIYGDGTIRLEQEDHIRMEMATLTKRYERTLSMDGVYSEAALFPQDDPEVPTTEDGEQQTLPTQRNCYLLTPAGDRNRLLEEIDRRTPHPGVPGLLSGCLDPENHTVLIHITHYDERRKLIYARILAKW